MQAVITPDQSRAARRGLGLSQADVSIAVNINRQYISEFENGYSSRITTSQLRKLRQFYEAKMQEAKDDGEEISITFGATSQNSAPPEVETFTAKRFSFKVAEEVSAETMAATLDAIATNDKRLLELLATAVSRDDGLFGSGEYTAESLEALRESFSLLSANYLLIRALGGWPEIGLSASGLKVADDVVLARLIEECSASFEAAGIHATPQAEEESELEEEEEA